MAHWEGRNWSVRLTDEGVTIATGAAVEVVPCAELDALVVRRGLLRWELRRDGRPLVSLRGLRRGGVADLRGGLRRAAVDHHLADAVRWHEELEAVVARAEAQRRWIPRSVVDALAARRPAQGLVERLAARGWDVDLEPHQLAAAWTVDADLGALVAEANEAVTTAELDAERDFFASIERTPLTEEQARAVTCFDDRVQLLAAAGSGKTSVMVARAAYAVHRGFVAPERILLLAFNRAAADELAERVQARFAAAGLDPSGVRATTFHAFGLEVIGAATGRKPRLATWLDGGRDVEQVLRIVDELSDASPAVRQRWDLYRTILSRAPVDLEADEPDGYDPGTRETGYRTFAGPVVRSHGERLIADFLFLNGVAFEYERPYAVDLADADHGQYRPDFYYPGIEVWHEHWALGRDGTPPASFDGYTESMAWKRQVHRQHGTTLVETTWADVVFGDGLTALEHRLSGLGVAFDWNPDRPIPDRFAAPTTHQDLARLVRTFMAHVKSNGLTRADVEHRLRTDQRHLAGHRTELFLDLFWTILDEWNRRLAADGSIDFEDMLVQAGDLLESGRAPRAFDLVLVDELQDASRARARLVRALLDRPGTHLLAVGDDWQSINRFAGADIAITTEFERWFGPSQQRALTTTFRCPQRTCDVARDFVTANPVQLRKAMRSVQPDPGAPVRVVQSDDVAAAIAARLTQLAEESRSAGTRTTVDVLGRYRHERDLVPRRPPAGIDVRFRTIHAAKGLEADHIIVANLGAGRYGFPSSIADDPVLALATPTVEAFPHAEERRLLYVALTRARRSVTLIAPTSQPSPFVVELLAHGDVELRTASGAPPPRACPTCAQGTLVERTGPYGRFLGCSRFPACRGTQPVG